MVYAGKVPATVAEQMRAPFQAGEFGGPIKYGYLSVAEVTEVGPGLPCGEIEVGQRVFCHYPHQDRYVAPITALTPIPDDVPSPRAVLAGVVETAINVLWDARPLWGDRVAVIGCGLIGATIGALLRTFPLQRLVVVDPDRRCATLSEQLGVSWSTPQELTGEFDRVVHCSATPEGLNLGLSVLGFEGELIEASWFGAQSPTVALGADFHAQRLTIRASQVSSVAASNRSRRTRPDRMALAMAELSDPVYDALISSSCAFTDLPATMGLIAAGKQPGWCHVVDYPTAEEDSCSP